MPGNIKLTNGYIELSKTGELDNSTLVLKLNYVGATAEVPASCRWTTVKSVGSYKVHIHITLDADTTLTVTSTGETGGETDGFRVANSSTMTNSGKIVVNGVMSVSSEGKVEGTGTIGVGTNGVLVVNKSDTGSKVYS